MNQDKLRSIVFKKANGNNLFSAQLYQMFFFEHILMRIEKSKYKGNIILKGGLLLSSIIGEDLRITKDMDATLKGISLEKSKIQEIFLEILNIDVEDNIVFEIINIKDIRQEDEYGGYQINILGRLDNIKTNMFVELTTGDIITPREIKYSYSCIFEDKNVNILAYPIETIIAEKFQTIISRNVLNTRAKDYYDLHILMESHKSKFDSKILIKAIYNTFKKRETDFDVFNLRDIFDDIKENENQKRVWSRYQDTMIYAKDISFEDVINSIEYILILIETKLV